jgi:guanine nucleotide-binding protein subunit alpha
LNKVDLFDVKIHKSPLNAYFPDFEGAPGDVNAARAFVRDRFLSLNKGMSKVIHTHYTCATDTKQIKVVMAAVQDILMRNNLKGLGLM